MIKKDNDSKDKVINIAVIGVGWIGEVHSECYKRLEDYIPGIKINLHAVVDISEDRVKEIAKRYKFKKWDTNWKNVIKDKEIDIVDICTSNQFHKEIAIAAAKEGKHILCEKPLSTDLKDTIELVEEIKKYNVKKIINFNYRKIPAVKYIYQLIKEGKLGEIYHFKCFMAQDFAMGSDVLAGNWHFKKSLAGGGSLVTMGIHPLDMARFLVGEFSEVLALSNTFIKERTSIVNGKIKGEKVDVDDSTAVLVKFKSGSIGTFLFSWLVAGRKHHFEFEINGSKGSVIFNSERMNEIMYCDNDIKDRRNIGFKNILIGAEHPYGNLFCLKTGMGIGIKESFIIQFVEFIKAILEDKKTDPDFNEGLKVQKIIDAIQRSEEKNEWVKM